LIKLYGNVLGSNSTNETTLSVLINTVLQHKVDLPWWYCVETFGSCQTSCAVTCIM